MCSVVCECASSVFMVVDSEGSHRSPLTAFSTFPSCFLSDVVSICAYSWSRFTCCSLRASVFNRVRKRKKRPDLYRSWPGYRPLVCGCKKTLEEIQFVLLLYSTLQLSFLMCWKWLVVNCLPCTVNCSDCVKCFLRCANLKPFSIWLNIKN